MRGKMLYLLWATPVFVELMTLKPARRAERDQGEKKPDSWASAYASPIMSLLFIL
jgi:hypothetical protein